jgi:hypothetical protein
MARHSSNLAPWAAVGASNRCSVRCTDTTLVPELRKHPDLVPELRKHPG